MSKPGMIEIAEMDLRQNERLDALETAVKNPPRMSWADMAKVASPLGLFFGILGFLGGLVLDGRIKPAITAAIKAYDERRVAERATEVLTRDSTRATAINELRLQLEPKIDKANTEVVRLAEAQKALEEKETTRLNQLSASVDQKIKTSLEPLTKDLARVETEIVSLEKSDADQLQKLNETLTSEDITGRLTTINLALENVQQAHERADEGLEAQFRRIIQDRLTPLIVRLDRMIEKLGDQAREDLTRERDRLQNLLDELTRQGSGT